MTKSELNARLKELKVLNNNHVLGIEWLIQMATDALELAGFYSNGANWTTHDDEYLFNNISDKDWDRSEDDKHFVGGLKARAFLAKYDTGE